MAGLAVNCSVNRASLQLDGINNGICDGGTVDVTIASETRRMGCCVFECTIIVQGVLGRFGRSSRWWELRIVSTENGERFEIWEGPTPSRLRDRMPDELRFLRGAKDWHP